METTPGSHSHDQSSSLSPDPPLHLIMIGVKEAGKSAAGNAILGTLAFDQVGVRTRTSVRQEALVRGRKVVVVDTPGWDWFNLRGTLASPIAVRKQIVTSMSLCHPGAHALLLVVPLSFSFSRRERQVAEEHVDLFGPKAWNHTLVLFTILDPKYLRDSSLKEEVETNPELQQLVERCGGRYNALHGMTRKRENHVAKLLSKIQEMVTTNGGGVLCSNTVLEMARKREEEEKRREEEEERSEMEERMKRTENVKIVKETFRKKKAEECGSVKTKDMEERR